MNSWFWWDWPLFIFNHFIWSIGETGISQVWLTALLSLLWEVHWETHVLRLRERGVDKAAASRVRQLVKTSFRDILDLHWRPTSSYSVASLLHYIFDLSFLKSVLDRRFDHISGLVVNHSAWVQLLNLQSISSWDLNTLCSVVDSMLYELACTLKIELLQIWICDIIFNILDAIIIANAVKEETLHVSALWVSTKTLLVFFVVDIETFSNWVFGLVFTSTFIDDRTLVVVSLAIESCRWIWVRGKGIRAQGSHSLRCKWRRFPNIDRFLHH